MGERREQVAPWRNRKSLLKLEGLTVKKENPGARISFTGHSWSDRENPLAPPEANKPIYIPTGDNRNNGNRQHSLGDVIIFQDETIPNPSRN